MRTHIHNAVILDGVGSKPKFGCVRIEDNTIIEVLDRPVAVYDKSDVVIDADGGYVLPGLVNHHAHGLTRGPLMIVGEPPLSDLRVRHNLDRQLAEGVTTALNVDGFATTEDAIAASKLSPLNVKVSTLHTPTHLEWAIDGPFPFGGVRDRHCTTADEVVARGAVAVGETGPGLDAHWADHTLIPTALEQKSGMRVEMAEAARLREATESGSWETVDDFLTDRLAGRVKRGAWEEIFAQVREWGELAGRACEEAVAAARRLEVPLVFHHSPSTFERICEAADGLGSRVIAAHSNFRAQSVDDAVARAREVRRRGAIVDVMTGDAFGAGQFYATSEVMFALFSEGLVDLISTDYSGGFWDPMLRVVKEAAAAGALELTDGVRMVTSGPADAVPGLAPQRGRVEPGGVADLLVTAPGDVAGVELALVSGHAFPIELRHGSRLSVGARGCC